MQQKGDRSLLERHTDWFSLLNVDDSVRGKVHPLLQDIVQISKGMMNIRDVEALAAALLACNPKRIFEIGTYRGASAELMLRLLPEAEVISIAFVRDARGRRQYNNDDLDVKEVGELVSPVNRDRYTQLIGDSHKVDPRAFLAEHGAVDFVFIDGDHSRDGVRQDTELARAILSPDGAIAWHDANPKRRYLGSRLFLEEDLPELALATTDDFLGGVALWTKAIEIRLHQGVYRMAGGAS